MYMYACMHWHTIVVHSKKRQVTKTKVMWSTETLMKAWIQHGTGNAVNFILAQSKCIKLNTIEFMCEWCGVCMSGVLQKHKWENCMTIDSGSWGFRRNALLADYLSIEQLITELAQTVRFSSTVCWWWWWWWTQTKVDPRQWHNFTL